VFDLGLGEMLVIAVLVIVFVGPEGLPDMMRVLGRFYAQIRRASDDLRRTFNAEVARVEADRRREELKQRRLARERARAAEQAAAGEAATPPAPAEHPTEEDVDGVLAPDPRLPPDAAPRVARPAPRPPPPGAAPRAAGPTPPAQPTFDGETLPPPPAKEN
jgi:sec-independent protein translocase protein TatB